MNLKKYNTSLSELYEDDYLVEGFGRLQKKAYYVDPLGAACSIDMSRYDNVRQFIFNVGQYGSPEDHKKAMGVLAKSLPVKIFSMVEATLGDKDVFDALFGSSAQPGILLDLATLGMTAMECRLFKFGIEEVSKLLDTFTKFKKSSDARGDQMKKDLEDAQRRLEAAGGATLAGILKPGQSIFLLSQEEQEKLSKIERKLRINKFDFKNKFASFNDPSALGDIDITALHFENFFGHYYENEEWDEDKLQEDIDIITDLARKISSIASSRPLSYVYRTFVDEISVRPSPTNVKILEDLEVQTQQSGSEAFEKKLLNMVFSPDVHDDSAFYGRIIYILSNNRKFNFSSSIKSKISLFKRDIKSLIS